MSRFLDLFAGNPEVVGLDDGRGPGLPGPQPVPPENRDRHWSRLVGSHLSGERGIGVYPWWQGHVRWGCVDFDEGEDESWEHAVNLVQALDLYQVTGWVERSRSKGYHVWVFADEWVEARVMRRALLGACQLVDAPTKEVNPKQDRLEEGQIGNFVRLPYKGSREGWPLHRQVIVDLLGLPVPIGTFLERAERDATEERLVMLGDLYAVPVPTYRPLDLSHWESVTDGMNRLARVQFRDGPKDGEDRSSWLYALACSCAESGLGSEQILAVLREADAQHGQKYTHRRDGEQRYAELVDRALARTVEEFR